MVDPDHSLRLARERLDDVVSLLHRVETDLRAGRPVEAEHLRAIRALVGEVRQSLRQRG